MEGKKSRTFKKILIWIISIIGGLFLCVALFFGWLTVTEYRPKDTEDIQLTDSFNDNYDINPGSIMSILTWNVGYGALGENADFFMDGGKMVEIVIPVDFAVDSDCSEIGVGIYASVVDCAV